MGKRLEGKVAVITGSTSGIGRASAELFAEQGARVVINGRRRELGQEVVADIVSRGGTAGYFYADMSKSQDIQALIQHTLEGFATIGRYQAHLRKSRRVYRKRRDAMLRAIDRHLPAGVYLDPPQGGLFVWLRLPDHKSADRLLPLALEEGVSFAPGSLFCPHPFDGDAYARLNFASQPPDKIEEGIQRLGRAIRRALN